MADFKDVLMYWKPIVATLVGGIVFIITTTLAVANWTESEIKSQVQLSEAKAALAHDYYFQQSRIEMKEIEIAEHHRELDALLDYIGDREPTPREQREIDYLDEEILHLRQEIENIKEKLADAHE